MTHLEEQLAGSLSNAVKDRHPSEDVFENILDSLEENNRVNKKGYRYIKRTLVSVGAVMILAVVLISSAFVSPVMAEVVRNIPVIGSIFEYMGDSGLKDAEDQGLVSAIRQSAEDNGIRITIEDALYDDARIVISFKEECKGEFKNFLNINNDLLIDDKQAPGFGIGITSKKAAEGVYVGLLTIDIGDPADVDPGISKDPKFFTGKLPDEFRLGFHINEIEEVKGTWYFDIPISKTESQKLTTKFKPQISKTHKDATLTLSEVIFAPSCVGLTFDTEPFGGTGVGTYRVFDEKGNELEVICDSIEEPLYLPVKDVPKALKIIPYTPNVRSERTAISKGFPMQISQGDLGEIDIQKIDFLPDKTMIYYDFKPKDPSSEPNRLKIIWKEALPSGEANYLLEGFPEGPTEKLKAPVKTGENSYVQEYKAIDPSLDLYIETEQSIDAKPIKAFEMNVKLDDPVR